ncbi:MAG: hypothetical protein RPR40_07290 [Bermanella sp.]
MATITLSTVNIISLTKLENSVRNEYGQRYNLSDPVSQFNLIKLAGESSNKLIKAAFLRFFDGLSNADRDQLIYRGVAYTHQENALVNKKQASSAAQPDGTDLPPGVKKIVYRGTVTYKKDGVTIRNPYADTSAQKTTGSSTEPQKKTRPTRIYRGNVIED